MKRIRNRNNISKNEDVNNVNPVISGEETRKKRVEEEIPLHRKKCKADVVREVTRKEFAQDVERINTAKVDSASNNKKYNKRTRTTDQIKQIKYKQAKGRTKRFPTETKEQLLTVPKRIRPHNELSDIELSELNPKQLFDAVTSKVEHYMLRGITNPQRLSALIQDTPTNTIRKAIEAVENRWIIRGSGKNYVELKGQLLARYDTIIEEGFKLYDDESLDMRHRIDGLKIAAQTNKELGALMGLGQADLQINIQNNINNVSSIADKIHKNAEFKSVALEFSRMLEEKKRKRLEDQHTDELSIVDDQ